MSKAGINRNLPNDEYQAAVNANNPSALNPFLTESDFDAAFGYGYFYRTTDDVAALPDTATAIVFDTTVINSGVTLGAPASRLVVDRNGIFNIQFSAQLSNTSLSDVTVTFWLRKNGTDIAGTSKDITIPGNNLRYPADWGWLDDATANDYYELVYSTPDVSAFLDADGTRITPVRPSLPSITVAVIQNGIGYGAGLEGTINLPITGGVLDQGTASTGLILDQNMVVYKVNGAGSPVVPANKTFYFQFIIPSGYDSGGELNLVISKTNPILNIALTAYVNGVPDATINATSIQPVVTYPTFEVKNLVFGTTLVPGNIVTVAIFFQGANNQDFWLRGISFKYNFNVI